MKRAALHRPYRIGITGGIGSGKSVVSHLLRLMGVPVYDCDSEAKRLMHESPTVRKALIEEIGEKVYDANGNLNRTYMAAYMFGNPEHVARVNAIVHPAVRADFKEWSQHSKHSVVAVESAILYEAHMENDVDSVWLVHAPEALRLQRATQRDKADEEAIKRRMQSQMSEQELLQRADRIVYNDGSRALIGQLWQLLSNM